MANHESLNSVLIGIKIHFLSVILDLVIKGLTDNSMMPIKSASWPSLPSTHPVSRHQVVCLTELGPKDRDHVTFKVFF